MRNFVLALSAAMLAAVPAIAQDKPTEPKPPKAERKICRQDSMTGTRLGGKRICYTKAQWAAIDNDNAMDLTKVAENAQRRQAQ